MSSVPPLFFSFPSLFLGLVPAFPSPPSLGPPLHDCYLFCTWGLGGGRTPVLLSCLPASPILRIACPRPPRPLVGSLCGIWGDHATLCSLSVEDELERGVGGGGEEEQNRSPGNNNNIYFFFFFFFFFFLILVLVVTTVSGHHSSFRPRCYRERTSYCGRLFPLGKFVENERRRRRRREVAEKVPPSLPPPAPPVSLLIEISDFNELIVCCASVHHCTID